MNPHLSEQAIDELVSRGVERVYPSPEFLREKLVRGERLTVYLGIDPTGPTLHVGHMIPLLKLRAFQRLGHRIILLIGDFTATIGDPSDKATARVPLTTEQVLANATLYKEQAGHFIDFDGENPAELRYNSEWLAKLSFSEILTLASKMTFAQMVKRDMFQKRIAEEKDLYLHEFLYPLMQGYDSVAMDVDGEVGGNDQTFNMLAGRDLMKKITGKEKFVITTKLLTDSEGAKMGKTSGNMLAFTDTPEEMFGKVMSWSDGMIIPGFELCTEASAEEIESIARALAEGENPIEKKMALAGKITAMYYGEEGAMRGRDHFHSVVQNKELPDDIQEVSVFRGEKMMDVVVSAGVVDSKTDYRRLIDEGAVKNAETGESMKNPHETVEIPVTLKIGKRRFLKISLKD